MGRQFAFRVMTTNHGEDFAALFRFARRFGPKNWIFVADDGVAARKLFSHKSPPGAKLRRERKKEKEERRKAV